MITSDEVAHCGRSSALSWEMKNVVLLDSKAALSLSDSSVRVGTSGILRLGGAAAGQPHERE